MSKALLRFIRLSPTKARLVAREVQGMNAEIALASLEFTPNKAAKVIAKVIASAVANGGYEAKSAIVHSCRVDAGPVLRRFMPRARGRATPIRKPTSHILVEVMNQNEIDTLKTSFKNSKKAVSKVAQSVKSAKKIESNETASVVNKSNQTKTSSTKTKQDDSQKKVAQKSATKTNKETKASSTTNPKTTAKPKTTKKDEDK
ncbi:50S ribosomal protein L22 [Helicobacter macacae]|uniref:Large ribosomal subunit protein uL22 n=1 Tax=Helicobacter macacae MIT 99-5501 TaxID=1357400 RepID=V8C8I3_9HELI|nr:50S ribosomal protein L22 [Helicobacter macacae MIT 99-5501]